MSMPRVQSFGRTTARELGPIRRTFAFLRFISTYIRASLFSTPEKLRNTLERCYRCGRWLRALSPPPGYSPSPLSALLVHDCPQGGPSEIGLILGEPRAPQRRGRPSYRVQNERKLPARVEIWKHNSPDHRRRLHMMLLGEETLQQPKGPVVWEGYVKDRDDAIRILKRWGVYPNLRVQRSRQRRIAP